MQWRAFTPGVSYLKPPHFHLELVARASLSFLSWKPANLLECGTGGGIGLTCSKAFRWPTIAHGTAALARHSPVTCSCHVLLTACALASPMRTHFGN